MVKAGGLNAAVPRGKDTAVTPKGTSQTCSASTMTSEKGQLTGNNPVTARRVEALMGKTTHPKQDNEHAAVRACADSLAGNGHNIATVLPAGHWTHRHALDQHPAQNTAVNN